MKTMPTNFWDLILGYISDRYIHYYKLKDDIQLCQLDTVFKALRLAAHQYTTRYGKVPVLFIDGADLLTKFDKEFTSHLISHAKVLANSDLLRIVLCNRIFLITFDNYCNPIWIRIHNSLKLLHFQLFTFTV